MRTIQQYLKECDRSAIINGYIYKYAFGWELMGSEYKDITCGEIVEKYKRTLNDYIDKLINITPLKNDKEMILMAYHSGEDDDVLFSLFKKEDIMDESLDYVTSYGYEFTEFEEVVGYYVADTYLTQYSINDLILDYLYETSWTGFNHERLQEDVDKLKEATEKAKTHKDDPDYFISAEEMFKSIEEEFGFEREKKDPGQETAWRKYIQCTAEYNTECRNIEIRKLRDLLNGNVTEVNRRSCSYEI